MSHIRARKNGRIGHITLTRPEALNALTHEMILAIGAALDDWAGDDEVACVLVDAEGEKAFSAGADLTRLHATARSGDFEYGRRFWRDEYRVNARIAEFPKPYVALMQGFTMGGGVGIACHGSHRIVGQSTRIAMPECAIGLIPDVGGSWLLAHAPGRLGEYLGLTGARMDASDALLTRFADHFVPESRWRDLTETLIETGDWTVIDTMAADPPDGALMALRDRIDRDFAGETAADVLRGLGSDEFARDVRGATAKNSPLSMACTVELIHRVRRFDRIQPALEMEYRFTSRAASDGDFIEGIRAKIIDKDNRPRWQHDSPEAVERKDIDAMFAPLGDAGLDLTSREA